MSLAGVPSFMENALPYVYEPSDTRREVSFRPLQDTLNDQWRYSLRLAQGNLAKNADFIEKVVWDLRVEAPSIRISELTCVCKVEQGLMQLPLSPSNNHFFSA
jgi:hypothetical protein